MRAPRGYVLGNVGLASAVNLAHERVVDAWQVIARGCDWTRLDERDRRRLATPLTAIAHSIGDLELLAAELADEARAAA